jgi:hypothetical protein
MKNLGVAMMMASCLVSTACGDDSEAGEGALGVEIWGEEFIETGIPASEFADGWGVTFDKFLVNVGEISVAEDGAAPAFEDAAMRVFDLAAASGPVAIGSETAPAGTYDHTAYVIAPTSTTSVVGNASGEDLQLMQGSEYSVYVEGAATNGTETVTFAWGFAKRTDYGPCHSTGVLEADGSVKVQLTIHGDHLFYDDAVSETPVLRFADIAAADTDSDGAVTQSELEAYDITALPNYGVGSYDIDNLWAFIEHMTSTLGHIDGEGHCEF